MRVTGCTLMLAGLLAMGMATAAAQVETNNPTPSNILKDFAAGALNATNWTVVPYYTFAPSSPQKHGGGIFAAYEVNSYIATGIGLDWLGEFRMPSANVELKHTFQPLASLGVDQDKWVLLWLSRLTVTPFAIAGIGVPVGGAGANNGSIAGIGGGGTSVGLWQWSKLSLSAGYAAVNWQNTGKYDGLRHELFLAFKVTPKKW